MDPVEQTTLVLNKNWKAVRKCSVADAVSLVYRGRAKIMDEEYNLRSFEDWVIFSSDYDGREILRTVRFKIRTPQVIVLSFYDKTPKSNIQFNRRNVFRRDNFTCQYCQRQAEIGPLADRNFRVKHLTLDHVVPKSKGGKTTWGNVVVACQKCNTKKGDKSLEELGWKLESPPAKPSYLSGSGFFSDRLKEDFIRLLVKAEEKWDQRT